MNISETNVAVISTHTLRGERDLIIENLMTTAKISTHTLRGERDPAFLYSYCTEHSFQLTRSVGSVTTPLRGGVTTGHDFNSHAPWGA